MDFFNSAVSSLSTVVVAIGAGVGVWGIINLMEATAEITRPAKARVSSSLWLAEVSFSWALESFPCCPAYSAKTRVTAYGFYHRRNQ